MHKKYVTFTIKTSYMFRPRWVISPRSGYAHNPTAVCAYPRPRYAHTPTAVCAYPDRGMRIPPTAVCAYPPTAVCTYPDRGMRISPTAVCAYPPTAVCAYPRPRYAHTPDRGEFMLPLNGGHSQQHILTQLCKCNPSETELFSLKMTQRGRNM
jgi:hypothetical protein